VRQAFTVWDDAHHQMLAGLAERFRQ